MTRPYRRRLIAGKINRFSMTNFNFFLLLFLLFGAVLFGPLMIGMEFDVFPYFFGSEEAALQYLLVQKLIWPPVLLLFILLVVATVVFTHRIAGPLYRFRIVLNSIAEGNLSVRAFIRKHDYLHEEVDCINRMIESLQSKVRGIDEQHREARTLVQELVRAARGGASPDLDEKLQQLTLQMERIEGRLREFKTS